jgi:hypothetical protein
VRQPLCGAGGVGAWAVADAQKAESDGEEEGARVDPDGAQGGVRVCPSP